MNHAPAGWYPDPWRQAPLRWWDGGLWTAFVAARANAGGATYATAAVGPVSPRTVERRSTEGAAPLAELPLQAAAVGVAGLAVLLLLMRLAVGIDGAAAHPAVAVFCAYGILYGGTFAICAWACRRWASGDVVADLGLRFRPADLGWAAIAWLVALYTAGRLVSTFDQVGVPFTSNNPFNQETASGGGLQLSHTGTLIILGVVMVVCAPLFEELLFRGVILRALRSRMGAAPAVALQGLVFGAYHMNPRWGVGNIGLVIVLAAMGIIFGVLAERTGRLGGGMIAHAILNGVAFVVGVTSMS